MNGLDQFYFEWMDWTISILNEWIGPVLGVTCESPSDSNCPGKPGNLHSEREKWENGKIYYSVKCAKDAFFVGYQSDKKWDIKVKLMFGAFFGFWKRQSVVFFCPCVLPCTYYKWKEKNACYKKRENQLWYWVNLPIKRTRGLFVAQNY